jgi:hypothetical protein
MFSFFNIVIVNVWRNQHTPAGDTFPREREKNFRFSLILIENKQMIRLFSVCWQKLTLKSSMIFTRRDSIVKIYPGQLTTSSSFPSYIDLSKKKETECDNRQPKGSSFSFSSSFVHPYRDDSSKHTGLIIKVILLFHVCVYVCV